MRWWDRLRLAAAALLCACYLAVFGATLWIDRDAGWPVSIYPMFAEGRNHSPLRTYRVFGVVAGPDGEREERIRSEQIAPLDSLRLLDGLTRNTPAEQAEALRFVLTLHAGFQSIRLYEEEWEAGGETLRKRTLLVQVP